MHRCARTCLIVVVGLLLAFGIAMLYSTSYVAYGERFLIRQTVWVIIGSCGACAVWLVDYHRIGRYSKLILGVVGASLLYLALMNVFSRLPFVPASFIDAMPFVSGPTKGSFRWLRLGGFSIQPSEFAKPALIIYLADYFSRRSRHMDDPVRGFIRPMGVSAVILGLVFMGRDLSSTVLAGAVVFLLAFIAGTRLRYLCGSAIFALVLLVAALHTNPERLRRYTVYRSAEEHQLDEGYQLWNSQLALGSGGAFGLGFTESRMKQLYLPEAHTDFIVAIVGEELGYAGVLLLIVGYVLVAGISFWIAGLTSDRQGILLCAGVGLSIGLHAFVNISVVSGFCPTTGVTAPFLSYGGSSMIATMLGLGLLLSVSRQSEKKALGEQLDLHFS